VAVDHPAERDDYNHTNGEGAGMSELRRDITTGEWVILAAERGRRPEDFGQRNSAESAGATSCPFCPGQESRTPSETYAVRPDGPANGPGWLVRVIPNKYPAVRPEFPIDRQGMRGIFPRQSGSGFHEVIIEGTRHDIDLADLGDDAILRVVDAYHARYRALRQDRNVRFIQVFRNHGERAGTSLRHPHSQLVALPLVPAAIRGRLEFAAHYFEATGSNVYGDLLRAERDAAERIVAESPRFVVFEPFASRTPFETWIAPNRNRAAFGEVEPEELADFATTLGQTLRRLRNVLGQFDYNYVIHTAPCGEEHRQDFCWHLQIIPRLTEMAGFELSTGMEINVTAPEDAAARLRNSTAD
jgi:UDPglucose--hexose-1-phosphate uridylyltransferase